MPTNGVSEHVWDRRGATVMSTFKMVGAKFIGYLINRFEQLQYKSICAVQSYLLKR